MKRYFAYFEQVFAHWLKTFRSQTEKLYKVSKITLDQQSEDRCSNVISLTLNRFLAAG